MLATGNKPSPVGLVNILRVQMYFDVTKIKLDNADEFATSYVIIIDNTESRLKSNCRDR